MPVYETALAGQEDVAAGTRAFRFVKPAGFAFKAGQSISLELLEPPAAPNSTRRVFSLASAPSDPELAVVSRMREGSAFKHALKALPPGAKVKIRGPLGAMTLHEDAARPAVLVAGGIGITPFLSMLRQAVHDRSPRRLRLIYSNRRPEDAPFLRELQGLEGRLPDFRLLATMTDMDKSSVPWSGARGQVTVEKVSGFVEAGAFPVFYVAGPPAMVDAMKAILARTGVRDFDMKSEGFYGY